MTGDRARMEGTGGGDEGGGDGDHTQGFYPGGAKTLWEALEMGIYCDIELVYVRGNDIIRFPTIRFKEDVVQKSKQDEKILEAEELKKYLIIPPEFVAPAPRPGYEWFVEQGCTSTMDVQPESWTTLYRVVGELNLS